MQPRPWLPPQSSAFVETTRQALGERCPSDVRTTLHALIRQNRDIYEHDCINLNPAGNVPAPTAEWALSQGLGSHPSLGYPGDKYETGLEAVEQIEIIAAQLAADVFGSKYVELRVPSGAIANLYAFMATTSAGDTIIAPPSSIGGHITHHEAGCAGLHGLKVVAAPVDAESYSVDVAQLRTLAREVRPKLITVGGSLNLFPHPLREIRAIADEVGAYVLYDAAHMCGLIAGEVWQQPLREGAHIMTMSTYKSLGGPAAGLILTNEASLAQRIEAVAYPGLTANFDVGKTASLGFCLLDWKQHGQSYASTMVATAKALGTALVAEGLPVFAQARGITHSHQLAVEADAFGGGGVASKLLRKANILTSGIGLPLATGAGGMNGIRFGTPEIVRWGMTAADMPKLASLIAQTLTGARAPTEIAEDVSAFRRKFTTLRFVS